MNLGMNSSAPRAHLLQVLVVPRFFPVGIPLNLSGHVVAILIVSSIPGVQGTRGAVAPSVKTGACFG